MKAEEESVDVVLQSLAARILERNLEAPALFVLEMYRPFNTIFYAFSLVGVTVLLPLVGFSNYQKLLQALETRENVEKLIGLLGMERVP